MPRTIVLPFALLLSFALVACGSEQEQISKPGAGKNDELSRLCELAGLDADCDICLEQGWLGDGTCDDFCDTPDPDCGAEVDRSEFQDPYHCYEAECDWVEATDDELPHCDIAQSSGPGSLGCEGMLFETIDDISDAGEFDTFIECWLDDAICFDGDKLDAALLLSQLFDEIWEGTRTLDDLNSEGPAILLYSTGEDGDEELLTVEHCQ